jgi:hypothetical protein
MSVPSPLRARLAADYGAVRPLPSPVLRALWVAPFALLAFLAAPTIFTVRADAPQLGWLVTWGASLAQGAIGFMLIAAALREAVPGRAWNGGQLIAWLVCPLLSVVVLTFSSATMSEIPLGDDAWWPVSAICLAGAAATALPVVALANVLAARAYPTRPAIAGLLLGLGAGLMADAGWRIFCHFGEPAHVLFAHFGGVIAAAAAGAAVAVTLRTPFR